MGLIKEGCGAANAIGTVYMRKGNITSSVQSTTSRNQYSKLRKIFVYAFFFFAVKISCLPMRHQNTITM